MFYYPVDFKYFFRMRIFVILTFICRHHTWFCVCIIVYVGILYSVTFTSCMDLIYEQNTAYMPALRSGMVQLARFPSDSKKHKLFGVVNLLYLTVR